jgi:HD-like signal output (HDOD) protein
VLGFDHALLGGEVARRWNFPPAIEAAIRFHHQADENGGEPLVLVTRAAHLLAAAVWDGRVGADAAESVPLSLLVALGLALEQLRACLPPLEEAMAASAAILPGEPGS